MALEVLSRRSLLNLQIGLSLVYKKLKVVYYILNNNIMILVLWYQIHITIIDMLSIFMMLQFFALKFL